MAWFFGGRSKAPRIRKDAGELTNQDFRDYPTWVFCLDEEGDAGQTECTVRPGPSARLLEPIFDGGVRAEIRFRSGRTMPGVVWLTLLEKCPPDPSVELWNDRKAGEAISDSLPAFSPVLSAESHRIGLQLPLVHAMPDAEARRLIGLAYKFLGASATEVWPLTVSPAIPIKGMPTSWKIPGWKRAAKNGDETSWLT